MLRLLAMRGKSIFLLFPGKRKNREKRSCLIYSPGAFFGQIVEKCRYREEREREKRKNQFGERKIEMRRERGKRDVEKEKKKCATTVQTVQRILV